jgi:membrane-associated protease RseP (regulator of RpoE activity)
MLTAILTLFLSAALAMVIHELGHLLAARSCQVPASEVGLGLGPRVITFQLGGVRFSLRALPVVSYVLLDGTVLEERRVSQQLLVHLGGILLNLVFGLLAYDTYFGLMNLLLAGSNLLPAYQHDGWKCAIVIMRSMLQRRSVPVERVFTYSGGFISLAIACAIIRAVT